MRHSKGRGCLLQYHCNPLLEGTYTRETWASDAMSEAEAIR